MCNAPGVFLNQRIVVVGFKKIHQFGMRTIDYKIKTKRLKQNFFS